MTIFADAMSTSIVIEGASKRYGKTVALEALSLEFPEGQLTGFLGPNGAGKTTTFRAVLGLTRLDAGNVYVSGMRVGPDTARIVKSIGAVVEEPGLIRTLNAIDNMRVACMTLGRGSGEIDELLEFVGLEDVAHRKVEGYSKGMKQRLALGMAMLGDPDIFILDEPLDGLDPAGQVILRSKLRALVDERAKTVIVSSHDLADIEQLADHVVVIHRGRRVSSGGLGEVIGEGTRLRLEVGEVERAVDALRSAGFSVEQEDGLIYVTAADGAEVVRSLSVVGIYPSVVMPEKSSLESVFLTLTEETS